MPLVPSIQVLTASRTLHNEHGIHTPVEWFMQIVYKTWMEGTHDKHNKIPYFLMTTEPKSNGIFTEM